MAYNDLTICSVSFHSAPYLRLNRELTTKLNDVCRWKWCVVENTPWSAPGRLAASDEEFAIIEGCQSDSIDHVRPASNFHGLALNRALESTQTRFVLTLDPDFFIVRRNWITEAILHMQRHALAFLGAPWHPKWYGKYRYFPCVHCMFIDTDKVDVKMLDFTPSREPTKPERFKFKHVKPKVLRMRLREVFLSNRRRIAYSQDTGYRVYARYAYNLGTKSECFIPVFKPYFDFADGKLFLSRWNRVLDKVLPDHLSFIPKRSGYFAEVGFFDITAMYPPSRNWEQFLWQNQPLGFHLRGYMQEGRDPDAETRALRTLFRTHLMGMTGPS